MAKILLAEDDQSMSNFIALALQKAGHEVIAAADGLEALATLNDTPDVDLLLTDIVMPGMDGIELSQIASKKRPTVKVMFITGFAAVAMKDRTVANSNTNVLSKPFHLNDLVAKVEETLGA